MEVAVHQLLALIYPQSTNTSVLSSSKKPHLSQGGNDNTSSLPSAGQDILLGLVLFLCGVAPRRRLVFRRPPQVTLSTPSNNAKGTGTLVRLVRSVVGLLAPVQHPKNALPRLHSKLIPLHSLIQPLGTSLTKRLRSLLPLSIPNNPFRLNMPRILATLENALFINIDTLVGEKDSPVLITFPQLNLGGFQGSIQ